jgi:hypothetical protein
MPGCCILLLVGIASSVRIPERSVAMKMRYLVAVVLALMLTLAMGGQGAALAAPLPPPCGPSATPFDLAGAFPATIPILGSPLLQATLDGITGTFSGHVVFEPLAAPPPALSDGCKEDSQFTLEGFTGSLTATGPLALELFGSSPVTVLLTTQSTNAKLQVHFGTEPNNPQLTFRSDVPVLFLVPPGQFVPVRLVQILGLQIITMK